VAKGSRSSSSLQIAVYLHGLAGDEGAQEREKKSLIATDIIEKKSLPFSIGKDLILPSSSFKISHLV